MARFHDLIDTLGVGDDGITVTYPETFRDDIGAAYDDDMGGAAAKISVLEADNIALKTELTAVKAHNYELLKATEFGVRLEDELDREPDNDGEETGGTDALFGDDKDKDK